MKLLRIIPFFLLLVGTAANAQFDSSWRVWGNDSTQQVRVSSFTSAGEARSIIKEIVAVMNLKVNFEVREANVPNAGAVFYNGKRYILYNPVFIRQIDNAAQTDWASISILAHEIGHHVLGHTFKAGGNSYQQELEADQFSGVVLRRMGATLEQAQVAMNMVASDRPSATHPARSYRLDAIAKGWNSTVADPSVAQRSNNTANNETSAALKQGTTMNETMSRSSVLADRFILVDVKFTTDEANEYFITIQNNVVRWDGQNLVQVGKVSKLRNAEYPFYIYDITKNYVLVTKDGYLVDKDGNRVGYLSMHTTSATAGR